MRCFADFKKITHHGLFPNSNDISILLHVSSHIHRPFHVLLLDGECVRSRLHWHLQVG